MTTQKPATLERHHCSWCNYPGATHEGGYLAPDGTTGSGYFCDEYHFKLWIIWQSRLIQSGKIPINGQEAVAE